jgi:hypothetical protein
MKKYFIALFILLLVIITLPEAHAAWTRDASGFFLSNICRNGPYWQVVPWDYVGSGCYMPNWDLVGQRVVQ